MEKGKISAQASHAVLKAVRTNARFAKEQWKRKKIIECYKIENEIVLEAYKKEIAELGGPPPIVIKDAGRTQIAAGSKTVLGCFAPVDESLLTEHYPFLTTLNPL